MSRTAWLVLTGMALGACGGTSDAPTGSTTEPPINQAPVTPGLLGLTITGLPAGTNADVSVVGANAAAFSRTATGSIGWTDVPPGRYTVTVRPVRAASGTFAATPSTQSVTVSAAAAATVSIAYKPQPSTLALEISGLPGGASGAVSVTPPRGTATAVPQSAVLTASAQDGVDATPDRWLIAAQEVVSGGTRFLPTPTALDTTIRLGDTARVAVRYGVGSGSIAVAIGGLPAGVSADAMLIAPDNGTRVVSGTQTITGLDAGRYKLVARALTHAGLSYRPSSDTLTLDVALSLVATPAPLTYVAQAGRLTINVTGVPNGANAAITLSNATGSRTITGSTTIDSLAAGSYTLSAALITSGGDFYAGSPAAQNVTIAVGGASTANVAYALSPTAVDVSVTGLPDGASAAITLTNPAGNTLPVTASTLINQAATGRWRLTASDVVSGGATYSPTPSSYDQPLAAGQRLSLPVQYAVSSGSIALVVSGLPAGSNGAVTVTGPRNYSTVVTGTTTLTNLAPGSYTITAASVSISGNTWSPAPTSQTVSVSKSLVATPATVTYALGSGSLALTVNGIASGSAAVTVTGPNGYAQAVTGSTTLSSLAPGTYTVSAASATSGGNTFTAAPASQSIAVFSSGTPASATVRYTQTTGSLALAVLGLPGGSNGSVTITGPNAFSRALTATTTLTGLAPGTYTVAAATVTISGNAWAPSPTSQTVTVTASAVAAPATVTYAQNPGTLALTVSGLPSASAAITVTGPNSYSQAVTSSTTLSNLSAGSYTITASNVTLNGNVYTPNLTTQTVTINGGATTNASVTYTITTGSLALTVSGLPGGANAAITVTGPNAYSQAVTASTTLSTLTPGSYTVSASNVTSGGTTYAPNTASQSVTVSASATAATASVTYAAQGGGGGGVNYTISNVYLTQAIQKPDGSVSLVANRDALLRVFVTANGANTAQPQVRVRIYDGATLLSTTTLNAPELSVRQTTDEGTLTSTWNTLVPAANVRTTLKVLVDLDPSQLVADADRSDNTWPSTGSPKAIPVATAPTFTVRFIPVTVGSLTGNVSAANKDQFLVTARRIWPIQNVVSDVRAPFTSSATDLQSNDGNGQWLTVLSEMNTLRSTDGAPSTMHYYGVVKVNYTSGVAGYGYVPGRAAMGWDYLPSGDGVAAHEWGHNFSRSHAPCGTSGDANYPYAGAVINYWGWNSGTNTLVSPTYVDVMSYCSPTWVSDYNWTAVLNYRATSGLQAGALQAGGVSSASTGPQDGLLVWGRVVNGAIQLEPAFRVTAPITPAAVRPTHRLDLLDDAGNALLQLPIEASLVDHVEGREERQFAVVVPYSAAVADRLQQIRVADPRAPLRSVARRATLLSPASAREAGARVAAVDSEPGESIVNEGSRVRVSWRNSTFGMAMVRDASTGQIMGYVRRPGAAVNTGGRRVEVVFSDGVRSAVKGFR